MKKVMSLVLAGSLVATAFSSKAQQISSIASNVNPVYNYVAAAPGAENTLNANEVNSSALTHFNTHQKSASAVTWTANGNVQSVYFTKNDVKMRSTYNEKGKLEYTLRYYTPSQAPKSIRDLVRTDYSNMSLLQVTEVERKGTRYHLVKMEDNTSFLTVRILNGEVDVYEKLNK